MRGSVGRAAGQPTQTEELRYTVFFSYRKGIHVPDLGLWLDPRRPRPRAFVSHAHADHIGHHDEILATPETLRFCELRLGGFHGVPLGFGESIEQGGYELRLHPAGHIVGSAQIAITNGQRRLVYTGDFTLTPGLLVAPCEIVPCDDLIMECTYGRPDYRFPPRREVIEALGAFVGEVLAGGGQPVVLAYALGRAQELIRILGDQGYAMAVADPIWRINEIFAELGYRLPPHERLVLETARGKVVLVPPRWGNGGMVRRLHRPVRIAVTGWAAAGKVNVPYAAEKTFVLSDHADFAGLQAYVEQAGPERVFTIHGSGEFAEHLRARGIEARPIEAVGW